MGNVLALQALHVDTDSFIETTWGWSTISNHCCGATYADVLLTTVGTGGGN